MGAIALPERGIRAVAMSERLRNGAIARLPILGWSTYAGPTRASVPGIGDAPHIVYTTSGRAAIALALRALGIAQGDRVLVPTYHCPTMIAPVVLLGAAPAFYPITDSAAPDLAYLQHEDLHGVRAMLVAHFFGLVQPLSAVRAFCDARGIALIEDCAHAYFGVSEGRPVGHWGDLAIASLTKFFPVPEGGCLVSASRPLTDWNFESRGMLAEVKAVADAVELGARHGSFAGLNAALRGLFRLKDVARGRSLAALPSDADEPTGTPSVHEVDGAALSKRLTRAARWIASSAHASRIVALRRRNYEMLAHLLRDLPGATPYRPTLPDSVAPYVFPLRVANPAPRYRAMRDARVPLFRWDRVWPGTPSFESDAGSVWATEMFQLACHQDLSEEDVRTIAAAVRRIVTEAG